MSIPETSDTQKLPHTIDKVTGNANQYYKHSFWYNYSHKQCMVSEIYITINLILSC